MPRRAWRPRELCWEVAPVHEEAARFARQLRVCPLVAQLLLARGQGDVESARAFLDPKLSDLHDPSELAGTEAAAERVLRGIREKQQIVIYGDYDVDGITAVAILHACIRMLGGDVHFYVPHRLEEGYGVNARAVRRLAEHGMDLLITVDCGISACGPLAQARDSGVDVIVTDHHAPPERLPAVETLIHPALPGRTYPDPHLSGAGVAFKLAWQIARQACNGDRVDEPLRRFLLYATALAALGTIADVVPLVGENRVLAKFGLKGLSATEHVGLQALIRSAGLDREKLGVYHVGFLLAPRLNAAGRMGHARLAVELLTDPAPERARQIADQLEQANAERKRVEHEITAEAVEMVSASGLDADDSRAIVLASDTWHGGVVGIVASRLVEQFARPTILIAVNGDGMGQGSGRSVPGLDMRDALAACAEHLIGFGGHAMAGGLRIRSRQIGAFQSAFCRYAAGKLQTRKPAHTLSVDVETSLTELSIPVVQQIRRLGPFGNGNPSPVLAVRGCEVLTGPKRVGRSGQTVTMMLGQGGVRVRAVGFGMADLADLLVGVNRVDLAAEPTLNHFNGKTSVELKLRDVTWS